MGGRGFSFQPPLLWNKLPVWIQLTNTFSTFKIKFTTFLLDKSYSQGLDLVLLIPQWIHRCRSECFFTRLFSGSLAKFLLSSSITPKWSIRITMVYLLSMSQAFWGWKLSITDLINSDLFQLNHLWKLQTESEAYEIAMKQSSTYRVILSIIWVILVIILPVFKNMSFVFTNAKKILIWILTANNQSPNWEYQLFLSDQFDGGLLTDLQACVTELMFLLRCFLRACNTIQLNFSICSLVYVKRLESK